MKSQSVSGLVALVVLSFGWSGSAVVTRTVQTAIGPMQQMGIQAWTAITVITVVWLLKKDREVFQLPSRSVLSILILRTALGVSGIALCIYAVSYVPLAKIAWLGALPYAAVWGIWIYGQKLTRNELGLIGLSVLGTILMVGYSPRAGLIMRFEEFLALAGHVLFSLGLVIGRSAVMLVGQKVAHYWSTLLMALCVTPIWIAFEGIVDAPTNITLTSIVGGLLWVLNGSLSLYGYAHVRAGIAQGILAIEGIWVLLLSYFIFQELPSTSSILGGLVITAAAIGMGQQLMKKGS